MSIALTELQDKWRSQHIHQKTAPLGGHGVYHSDPPLWDGMSPMTPLQLWLWGHILPRLLPANDQDHWAITKAKLFLPDEAGPLWWTTCLQAKASPIQLHPPSFPQSFHRCQASIGLKAPNLFLLILPLSFNRFLRCLLPSWCLLLIWPKLTFQEWKRLALWWAIKGECFLWQITEPRREPSPSF